jgi:hypothetical protein
MSYSYDVSVRLSKQLTTVSSSLYQLGFCTAGDSTVSPPLLQIAVAGSGTSVANAVQAKCYTIGTNAVSKSLLILRLERTPWLPTFTFGKTAPTQRRL